MRNEFLPEFLAEAQEISMAETRTQNILVGESGLDTPKIVVALIKMKCVYYGYIC
jgi:hypothetical protein